MADDVKGTAEETSSKDKTVSEEKTDTQPKSEEAAVEKEESDVQELEKPTPDWENEKKSLAGRISKLQKKVNKHEQQSQYLDALNKAAANDPDFMRLANEKLVEQGVLDKSVIESLPKKDKKSGETEEVPSEIQWARQKQQQEVLEETRFFQEFEKDKPDIGPEDNPTAAWKNRQIIKGIAEENIVKGMDKKVAYDQAYLQYLHPEKLKEEGEIEGLVKAQSTTPTIGGASGQQTKSSGGSGLSDAEKDAATKLGMTEDDYVKFRDNPPELKV